MTENLEAFGQEAEYDDLLSAEEIKERKRIERQLALEQTEIDRIEQKNLEHPIEEEPEAPSEKQKLQRELRAEALARLEHAARTPEDFQKVIAWWDKLDANRERKERYRKSGENYVEITENTDVSVDKVYMHQSDWGGTYSEFSNVKWVYDSETETGSWTFFDDPIEFVFLDTEKNVSDVLNSCARLSAALAPYGGDCIHETEKPKGDSNGSVYSSDGTNVVTFYKVPLKLDNGNYMVDLKAMPGMKNQWWINNGMPISDNEYIVFNVVVPNGVEKVGTGSMSMALLDQSGTKNTTGSWGQSTPHVEAFSRIIWNFVNERIKVNAAGVSTSKSGRIKVL